MGLSIQKKHIPSIANTIETDMSNSRIIEKINLRMVIRKDLKSQSIIKKYWQKKMTKSKEKWIEFIQLSFLSTDFKEKYIQLINERFERITEKAIDEIITEK